MTTKQALAAPPFDPELAPVLAEVLSQMSSTISLDDLVRMRTPPPLSAIEELLADRDVVYEDRTVPGLDGDPDITVSIFRKRTHVAGGPGIYNIHGGGMQIMSCFDGNYRAGAE